MSGVRGSGVVESGTGVRGTKARGSRGKDAGVNAVGEGLKKGENPSEGEGYAVGMLQVEEKESVPVLLS